MNEGDKERNERANGQTNARTYVRHVTNGELVNFITHTFFYTMQKT